MALHNFKHAVISLLLPLIPKVEDQKKNQGWELLVYIIKLNKIAIYFMKILH